jgi:transcription elongation factor Elf1
MAKHVISCPKCKHEFTFTSIDDVNINGLSFPCEGCGAYIELELPTITFPTIKKYD